MKKRNIIIGSAVLYLFLAAGIVYLTVTWQNFWCAMFFAPLLVCFAIPISWENDWIEEEDITGAIWLLSIIVAVTGVFGWAATPTRAQKRKEAAKKVAKPHIQTKSSLATVLTRACNGHVIGLQQQLSDGDTKFWLVVCKDGTIKRINPADYGL